MDQVPTPQPVTDVFVGRPTLVPPAVIGLEIVLLALWFLADPWSGRTTDSAQWFGTLSALAGLTGLLLYAVTIVLSARFSVIESYIGGLDKVYRQHHLIGCLSLIFLVAHPSLLAWKYARISLERSAHLFGPSTRWPLLAGQIALYVMIPALTATIYVTVRHQTLIALQRLLGLMFLPAAYHALFTGGDAYRYAPLRIYLALLCAAAVAALLKHSLFGRRLDAHQPFTVESVTHRGSDYAELWLQPEGQALRFVPGQFAYLRFPNATVAGESHPFSLAGPPNQKRIRFVVKELGDWTKTIETVPSGTVAVVEGPYGRFSHRFVKGRSQLWIAGGIGITPFLSMAASLAPKGCPYDVDLVWCYPTPDAAPFLDELYELSATRPHLRVHARCDLEHPLPTAQTLADLCAESPGTPLASREVLMCGPEAMRSALRSQLIGIGVESGRIHSEEFGYA